MRRDLYGGLLGGVDSALAWGLAEKSVRAVKRQRLRRQLTQAIAQWEDEGGALSAATGAPRPSGYCRTSTGKPTPSE